MFQDDPLLVYGEPSEQNRTLDTLHALGVDRIRVSVFWALVAPATTSRNKPTSTPPIPAPTSRRVGTATTASSAARRRAASPSTSTSPAGPRWASTGSPARRTSPATFTPNGAEFGLFVRAVGTRYSGQLKAGGSAAARRLLVDLERAQPGRLADAAVDARPAQRQGPLVEAAPSLYRALVAAAWRRWPPPATAATRSSSARPRRKGQQRPGHHAVDRRAALHPPTCTASTATSTASGDAGRAPAAAREPTRSGRSPPRTRAVPGHRLRPPSLRAAFAAAPQADGQRTASRSPTSAKLSRELQRDLPALRPAHAEPSAACRCTSPSSATRPAARPARRVAFTGRRRGSTRPSTSPTRTPTCATLDQFLLVDDAADPGPSAQQRRRVGRDVPERADAPERQARSRPTRPTRRRSSSSTRASAAAARSACGVLRAAAPNGQVQQVTRPVQAQRQGPEVPQDRGAADGGPQSRYLRHARARAGDQAYVRLALAQTGARKATYSRAARVTVYGAAPPQRAPPATPQRLLGSPAPPRGRGRVDELGAAARPGRPSCATPTSSCSYSSVTASHE